MTLLTAPRRAPRSLPATALVLAVAASTACSGKRPTFGKPLVHDAGGSSDDMGDAAVSEDSTYDGSSNADGSTTDTETSADTNDDDDDTTSSTDTDTTDTDTTDTGGSDPEGTSDDGSDIDAGSNTGTTSDDGSVACSEGRYAADNGECQAWTECEPGTYVASPGTADSDQECQPCESGTYSDAANATECLPWDDCGWFETSQAGTNTSNVECLQADTFDQFGTEGYDGIQAMATDASGRVVVAGWTDGALYEDSDGPAFVRLYDSEGQVEWTRQFGEEFQDQLNGVSFASDGDILIAGAIDGVAVGEDPAPSDAFVARLSASDGTEIWRRRFGTSLGDAAYGLATGSNGTSVVVGETSGSLSGTSYGGSDAFVHEYGSTGEVHWARQFGTENGESATAVAIARGGEIAVVGSTGGDLAGENAGSGDGFLRVYVPGGTSHRTVQFGAADITDQPLAVAFLPGGEVAVAGLSVADAGHGNVFLRLYRATEAGELELLWARTVLAVFPWGIKPSVSADASGNVVVAVTSWEPDSVTQEDRLLFLQRYDVDGALLAEREVGVDGDISVNAVALVGTEEHVLVGGTTSGTLSGTNAGNGDAFVGIVALPSPASQ